MKKFLFLLLFCVSFLTLSALEYRRESVVSEPKLGKRKRVAPRILAFPEMQYKYGLFQNFLDGYIDKPLFFDRSLRFKGKYFSYITPDSFFRDCDIIRSYGFDGGGSLASGVFDRYKIVTDYLKKYEHRVKKGYMEFPQLFFGEALSRSLNASKAFKTLEIAMQCKFTPRIGKRIPISTYASDAIPRDKMLKFVSSLRKKFGAENLGICGALHIDWRDNVYFHQHGKWSDELIEKYRKRIAQRLADFDGLQLEISFERHAAEFHTIPDFAVFDTYLLPMVEEAFAKKENRGKFLCVSALQGYANHISCEVRGEYGTARMRGVMERIMKLNCDFWFAFEWNEFNENSFWQPTISNTLSLQRLTKYYIDLMNDRQPRGNEGDDLGIPQMVLSHRQMIKTGEILRFELLNIPDGTAGKYKAQLILRDLKGKKIHAFPQETFDRKKLHAVTYHIPSEELSRYPILRPELRITGSGRTKTTTFYRELQHVKIHPTYCRNYKEVRASLRDLLRSTHSFTASGEKGNFRISGNIKSAEKLASVEVLDRGREVWAYDVKNEFALAENELFMGAFSTPHLGTRDVKIEFKNCRASTFREWHFPSTSIGSNWRKRGNIVSGKFVLWSGCIRLIMTVPKKDLAKAELHVTLEGETHKIKLADLKKNQMYSMVFPKCRFDLQHYRQLADYPHKTGKRALSFNVPLLLNTDRPIFQMRAVTESGKVSYGAPFMPVPIPEKFENLTLFSEAKERAVTVKVPSALLPRLRYDFDPRHGAAISNGYSAVFNGVLGGGYVYGGAFSAGGAGARNNLPSGRHDPAWKQEKGAYHLEFDGKSYLQLPSNSFPRGSFSLEFECRPRPDEGTKMYMLCRHYAGPVGSMTLYSKENLLSFIYFGRRDYRPHVFTTDLRLEPGKWNKVKVTYDFDKVRFTVNGRTGELAMPNNPARSCKPFIFGGQTRPGLGLPKGVKFFKGDLKSLYIDHGNPR